MAHQKDENNYLYYQGRQLDLRSHQPPLPFGSSAYKENLPLPLPSDPDKSDNQLDYVFRKSPLATPAPSQHERLKIVVNQQLSVLKTHGAQLLVCNISGYSDEVRLAKIYDPLYYQWENEFGNREAVVLRTDQDYSREAAAYRFLSQQGYNGILDPKYYGSWAFTLTGHQGQSRSVRLILIEYVPAPSLWQQYYTKAVLRDEHPVPPNRMTHVPDRFGNFDEFRAKVYESFLKIKAKQFQIGLNQRDFAPRNVLAVLSDSTNQDLKQRLKRVFLVDYNISIVYPMSNIKFSRQKLPENPLKIHWDGWLDTFDGWVPKAWQDNRELHRRWLYEKFGSYESRKNYMPLSAEFSETLKHWLKAHGKRDST